MEWIVVAIGGVLASTVVALGMALRRIAHLNDRLDKVSEGNLRVRKDLGDVREFQKTLSERVWERTTVSVRNPRYNSASDRAISMVLDVPVNRAVFAILEQTGLILDREEEKPARWVAHKVARAKED